MFLMLRNTLITKDNIEEIFNELSKEYVKLGGNKILDFYLVGGAAIVLDFSYRLSTLDIDAFFEDNSILYKAIDNVSKKMNLPKDWINKNFVNTPSFSPKLFEKATLCFEFNNIIKVYSLHSKYILAMKIRSSRPTGGDLDDILMMIYEMRYKNINLTYEDVLKCYKELYKDFSNTYTYFFEKTKEAFEKPISDFAHFFKKID